MLSPPTPTTVRASVRASVQFRPLIRLSPAISFPLRGGWTSQGAATSPVNVLSIDTSLSEVGSDFVKLTISFEVDLRLRSGLSGVTALEHLVAHGSVLAGNADIMAWSPATEAFRIFRCIVERMALQSGQPESTVSLEAISNTPGLMSVSVALDGSEFVPVEARVDEYTIDRMGVRGQEVDQAGLEFALQVGPTSLAHHFVLLADRAQTNLTLAPNYLFVSALTTAMEVGCYSAWRDAHAGSPPPNFSPKDYLTLTGNPLGRLIRGKQAFAEYNSRHATDCEELWGTRHELLHNGQERVRVGGDRSNIVPYSHEHGSRFRAAVMALLAWLN